MFKQFVKHKLLRDNNESRLIILVRFEHLRNKKYQGNNSEFWWIISVNLKLKKIRMNQMIKLWYK
jgi:hypothetical protein